MTLRYLPLLLEKITVAARVKDVRQREMKPGVVEAHENETASTPQKAYS
jgi:hypothetical protein